MHVGAHVTRRAPTRVLPAVTRNRLAHGASRPKKESQPSWHLSQHNRCQAKARPPVRAVYTFPAESAPLLESAYRSCLMLANEHKLKSIAFPAISCGGSDFPTGEAAEVR